MPARHESLQDGPRLEADIEPVALLTKEGVGETSGQRSDRSSKEFALSKRSGRRNRFSSFGADLPVRNFIGLKARTEIWS